MTFRLICGDRIEVMRTLPDNLVDSIVTDPPYGLGKEPDALAMLRDWLDDGHHEVTGGGFMGQRWDSFVPGPAVWRECLRVLKPGGYLLAFAGSRTQDLMGLSLRIAGFEIRDCIFWVYGSGFPKSLDVSKAIDKAAGVERERIAGPKSGGMAAMNKGNAAHGYRDSAYYDDGNMMLSNEPATDDARQWQGWGTALKPAYEPIIVARKPLEGTVAANVLKWGTGAINVDGCRVATDPAVDDPRLGGNGAWTTDKAANNVYEGGYAGREIHSSPLGRWPANIIHDGSDEVLGLFPDSGGSGKARKLNRGTRDDGWGMAASPGNLRDAGSGSAARFFYCAKASKADRDDGCDDLPAGVVARSNQAKAEADRGNVVEAEEGAFNKDRKARNHHPTVKPTDLMRYLCRLVTPPGGVVLDNHTGSGSTGRGAVLEGFRFIGIDNEPDYIEIARARITAAVESARSEAAERESKAKPTEQPTLFDE